MKNISWSIKKFQSTKNRPTLHSEKGLVNLERGRQCFIGLSKLLVYAVQFTFVIIGCA